MGKELDALATDRGARCALYRKEDVDRLFHTEGFCWFDGGGAVGGDEAGDEGAEGEGDNGCAEDQQIEASWLRCCFWRRALIPSMRFLRVSMAAPDLWLLVFERLRLRGCW